MRRPRSHTALVALVSAAVIGAGAGIGAAMMSRPDSTERETASEPSGPKRAAATTASPSGSASTDPLAKRLLWAEPGRIHDGSGVIEWRSKRRPAAVARARDGYLVAFASNRSDNTPRHRLMYVDTSGDSTHVTDVVGEWDLNESLDQVVGQAAYDSKPAVWDLSGDRIATFDAFPLDGVTFAGWAGRDVQISYLQRDEYSGADNWVSLTWNPVDNKVFGLQGDQSRPGYQHMRVSPDGRYLGGLVNTEGNSVALDEQACFGLSSLVKGDPVGEPAAPVSWFDCGWVPQASGAAWGPEGSRLLMVPTQSEGQYLSQVGLVDTKEGPDKGVVKITLPEGAVGATWDEKDTVYAYGFHGEDPQAQVQYVAVCSVLGCTEVLRGKPGRQFVVGEDR